MDPALRPRPVSLVAFGYLCNALQLNPLTDILFSFSDIVCSKLVYFISLFIFLFLFYVLFFIFYFLFFMFIFYFFFVRILYRGLLIWITV
jgi:hypothetical protein